MPGFSGKNGTALISGGATIYELTAWTHTPKISVPKWASNATSGVKTGVPGIHDSEGKIEVKLPDNQKTPFRPGSQVTLELHADSTGNNYIKLDVIIESMPVDVKVDPDGEPVSMTYNYQGITRSVYYGIFAPTGSSSGY